MKTEQLYSTKASRLLDGQSIAKEIIDDIKSRVTTLDIRPGLAVVLVGQDPASEVYVNIKSKRAKECGFNSRQHTL